MEGKEALTSPFGGLGCNAQIRIPSQLRTKLQSKSTPGIFIGYASGSNGYRFWDPQRKKLIESGDAVFLDQDTPRRAKRARVELLVEPEDISLPETEPLVQEIMMLINLLILFRIACLGEVGGIHNHLHI